VDAVSRARRVDIYGSAASALVGQDLHHKLHRIGLVSFMWTDAHLALTSAAVLQKGDVAVGISHTGTTIDTIDVLRVARRRGATTIAITNFEGSPITEEADLLLVTAARETTFRSGAMSSRIAQLAVVDCLFAGIAQRSYDQAIEALEGTFAVVRSRHSRRGKR
jgi:DNA-binding MurR/RpiR family transcriptional regulator